MACSIYNCNVFQDHEQVLSLDLLYCNQKKKRDICISLMFREQKLTGSTENCYSFFGTLGPDWFCNLIYITRRFSLGAHVAYYVSPDWDPFAVLIVILFWYRNGFDNFYTSKIS